MVLETQDTRLESRFRELLVEHRRAARRADWTYYHLLPWGRGEPFHSNPWRPAQRSLSEPLALAVETALLTEVNLPWFTTDLMRVFRGSLEPLIEFVHDWTAEEDQHARTLETYLLLTRNADPDRLERLRKQVVRAGFESSFETPFEVMVYTSIQELTTFVYYSAIARAAAQEDALLAQLLRKLAKDEILHYTFYRDAVSVYLSVDANYIEPLARVLLAFEMPGKTMPDYHGRLNILASHGLYGPEEYLRQVIEVLLQRWDVVNLNPTYPAAREAVLQLRSFHARYARMVDAMVRRRTRSP